MNYDLWASLDVESPEDLTDGWSEVGYVDTTSPASNAKLGKHIASVLAGRSTPPGRSVTFYAFLAEDSDLFQFLAARFGSDNRATWPEKESPRFRLAIVVHGAPPVFFSGYATTGAIASRPPERHPGMKRPGVAVGLKGRARPDRAVLVRGSGLED